MDPSTITAWKQEIRQASLLDGHDEEEADDLLSLALTFRTIHGPRCYVYRDVAREILDVENPSWRIEERETLDCLLAHERASKRFFDMTPAVGNAMMAMIEGL